VAPRLQHVPPVTARGTRPHGRPSPPKVDGQPASQPAQAHGVPAMAGTMAARSSGSTSCTSPSPGSTGGWLSRMDSSSGPGSKGWGVRGANKEIDCAGAGSGGNGENGEAGRSRNKGSSGSEAGSLQQSGSRRARSRQTWATSGQAQAGGRSHQQGFSRGGKRSVGSRRPLNSHSHPQLTRQQLFLEQSVRGCIQGCPVRRQILQVAVVCVHQQLLHLRTHPAPVQWGGKRDTMV
jgi:hypothetical protein